MKIFVELEEGGKVAATDDRLYVYDRKIAKTRRASLSFKEAPDRHAVWGIRAADAALRKDAHGCAWDTDVHTLLFRTKKAATAYAPLAGGEKIVKLWLKVY